MALNTQSFASLISNWATAAQGKASQLKDFTIGSILRAIDEATAYVALWLQGLILQAGAISRAATSNGTDLDSWLAQFGFSRLPAVSATMPQTFSRYTATAQALIYPGATVQTQDGSVVFAVIADTTNSNYSTSLGAYVIPSGTTSINAMVQCSTAGVAGNVQANTVTSLTTAIPGVDFVNNASAAINGEDAESDSSVRARFILWIASLEAATVAAVKNAIANVQQGMSGIIVENTQYNGTTQNGYFTAIINNGSGTASSTDLANAANAIDAARPLCSTFGAHAPTAQAVNIAMSVTTGAGYVHSSVVAEVIAALSAYIQSITTTESGATLPYTQLAAVAYGIAGVTNVTGVLLNSGTSDLTITYAQAFQPGTISVL